MMVTSVNTISVSPCLAVSSACLREDRASCTLACFCFRSSRWLSCEESVEATSTKLRSYRFVCVICMLVHSFDFRYILLDYAPWPRVIKVSEFLKISDDLFLIEE
jgi:hypothetical protein